MLLKPKYKMETKEIETGDQNAKPQAKLRDNVIRVLAIVVVFFLLSGLFLKILFF